MVDTHETPIGSAIRRLRQERGLKLAGVSRHVPVSTLNAIEHGRMVPSLPLADTITLGLGLPVGSLDLPLLASVRDLATRSRLVERLLDHEVSPVKIQGALRSVARSPDMPRVQRQHAQFLLAQLVGDRGAPRRAVVLLRAVIDDDPPLRGTMTRDAFSTLGRFYLQLHEPQAALGYLLRAVDGKPGGDAWESAMCNLGLAWWKLGQYRMAESQWRQAVATVTTPVRLANAHFGLGLFSFRQGDYQQAASAYQEVLRLYDHSNASTTMQLQVLNNLVACRTRQGSWAAAEDLARQAPDLTLVDTIPRGEWLTTLAELAWGQGQRERAMLLIQQAKDALDDAMVVSWFTVRLLEMTIGCPSTTSSKALMAEIESRIVHIHDRELMHTLYIMLAQQALQAGYLDEANDRLHALRTIFPVL